MYVTIEGKLIVSFEELKRMYPNLTLQKTRMGIVFYVNNIPCLIAHNHPLNHDLFAN